MKAAITVSRRRLLKEAVSDGAVCRRRIHSITGASAVGQRQSYQLKATAYSQATFSRDYVNVGQFWTPVRNQYTKYRITKPWSSDSTYDDIFLAEPSRDELYAYSKEMPVFLKFLKLLTESQNRKEAFVEFAKRCENGLVVEKDAYATKPEIMDCMWRNGYKEEEIDAIKLAFPEDYKFHYPELAVMFELDEADCYKYCIKMRASNPEELVELKLKKPNNLVSSYGLVFLGCWFGLSNAVLGNAWFFAKTLPFGAVFYMLAAYFQKTLKEMTWKEENALIDKAKEEKDYCEDAIYGQLSRYMDTSKCTEYVDKFREEVSARMKEYRKALLLQIKNEAARKMNEKLNSMMLQENTMVRSVQKTMVDELIALFKENFSKNAKMQEASITSALADIVGKPQVDVDPVYNFFNDGLASFQNVRSAEALEVGQLAQKCRDGDSMDLSRLSDTELDRAQQLFDTFNNRFGYYVPEVAVAVEAMAKGGEGYIKEVNDEVNRCAQEVVRSRLAAFLKAFL
ncbi:hypothetical protein BgAZ_108320 [Babesia gibsoni]|uniref:Uncharacterized protein n=1 Tax=Babesia gibsoni TaxID=33632 RepID=A0AAD8UTY0_BABGI|nr:hypothetical protein BgAZ_108320 [Babesia gibsoni]